MAAHKEEKTFIEDLNQEIMVMRLEISLYNRYLQGIIRHNKKEIESMENHFKPMFVFNPNSYNS